MPNFATLQVKEIQLRLHHLGFDPGTIDGAWGRRTQAAVRKFQSSNGLVADGIVGPKTYSALLQHKMPSVNTADDVALVWFQEARRLKGIRENLGVQSNSIILNWADDLGIAYSGDDVPWCGLFTAHCIGATLASEPLPSNPLAARSWLKFGGSCEPGIGAVLVFWRENPNGWLGHVGFYAGESEDGKAFLVLGGNQSNKVGYAWIAKNRLLSARWPATAPAKTTSTFVAQADDQMLSENEA